MWFRISRVDVAPPTSYVDVERRFAVRGSGVIAHQHHIPFTTDACNPRYNQGDIECGVDEESECNTEKTNMGKCNPEDTGPDTQGLRSQCMNTYILSMICKVQWGESLPVGPLPTMIEKFKYIAEHDEDMAKALGQPSRFPKPGGKLAAVFPKGFAFHYYPPAAVFAAIQIAPKDMAKHAMDAVSGGLSVDDGGHSVDEIDALGDQGATLLGTIQSVDHNNPMGFMEGIGDGGMAMIGNIFKNMNPITHLKAFADVFLHFGQLLAAFTPLNIIRRLVGEHILNYQYCVNRFGGGPPLWEDSDLICKGMKNKHVVAAFSLDVVDIAMCAVSIITGQIFGQWKARLGTGTGRILEGKTIWDGNGNNFGRIYNNKEFCWRNPRRIFRFFDFSIFRFFHFPIFRRWWMNDDG